MNDWLLKEGLCRPGAPIFHWDDPYFQAALFLAHGEYHGEPDDLPEAKTWIERSLARGEGIVYRGVLLGIRGLFEHRMGDHEMAIDTYLSAMEQLLTEIRAGARYPPFLISLEEQLAKVSIQRQRARDGMPPNVVLTQRGEIEDQGERYDTGGYAPILSHEATMLAMEKYSYLDHWMRRVQCDNSQRPRCAGDGWYSR